MTEHVPQFRRQGILRSGYARNVELRDRITCLLCDGHVTVPAGQTIPMTVAQLGHRCGDPLWNVPPYIPSPHGRPIRRREPVLTEEARRAFEQAARREDVTA